jgi:hypothetical protein
MRFPAAIIFAITAGAMVVSAIAAPLPKKETFASPDAILKWMNGYRAKPDPTKLPLVVHAMSDLSVFRDLDTAGVYIGFIAGVLGSNEKMASDLVAKMFPLPPEDQVAIVKAIAYSGLPDWQGLMRSVSERMPARSVMIDRYLTGKMATLKDLALDTGPAPLDTLWGYYLATGSYEPVLRIISVLGWSKDANNLERLTIGSMAKWTLASNATRDKDLLDMCKAALATEPKETADVLKEIIEAAETFEIAKIRKDAVAAIEQLKMKGPASSRNMAWWGQAGTTVLALGCVVAAALGQVEIGIPCVIGGAASTAAVKYLAPQ